MILARRLFIFLTNNLTHCLICCLVETGEEALASDIDTPERETCPNTNTGHLILCEDRKHTTDIRLDGMMIEEITAISLQRMCSLGQ